LRDRLFPFSPNTKKQNGYAILFLIFKRKFYGAALPHHKIFF